MIIRVGIPASFRRFSAKASAIGAPVLVSANAFWKGAEFRTPSPDLFSGCDTALDSAGFVAMVRYKGYRWSVHDYVKLVASYPWAWWAAMDYCCEPQVAADKDEVRRRVELTAKGLAICDAAAAEGGVSAPMPVIQGWMPDDYERCAELMPRLGKLVGIGSVCRRSLGGPYGLFSVLTRLDRVLSQDIQFHLFGVKGTAIEKLAGHPRIFSVDSMGWDAAARWKLAHQSKTVAKREAYMAAWYRQNVDRLSCEQRRLPGL
jgi:hypothetical protein